MPGKHRPAPDDRHFAHYVELHASDSVDEAVMRAERWAKRLLAEPGATASAAYPRAAWFAVQIVDELRAVRHYLGQGQRGARKAVWYALRLGEVIAEARLLGYLNGPQRGANDGPPPGPIPPAPQDDDDAP